MARESWVVGRRRVTRECRALFQNGLPAESYRHCPKPLHTTWALLARPRTQAHAVLGPRSVVTVG